MSGITENEDNTATIDLDQINETTLFRLAIIILEKKLHDIENIDERLRFLKKEVKDLMKIKENRLRYIESIDERLTSLTIEFGDLQEIKKNRKKAFEENMIDYRALFDIYENSGNIHFERFVELYKDYYGIDNNLIPIYTTKAQGRRKLFLDIDTLDVFDNEDSLKRLGKLVNVNFKNAPIRKSYYRNRRIPIRGKYIYFIIGKPEIAPNDIKIMRCCLTGVKFKFNARRNKYKMLSGTDL